MLKRYQDWSFIGQGSFGQVYRAWDKQDACFVAIKKVTLPAISEKQGALWMKKIDHPSVPKILAILEDGLYCYIVMSYCPGCSLAKAYHQLPKKKINQLTRTLFEILSQLWQLELVFGDLKPENILMDDYGRFYLIDFGSVTSFQSLQVRFGSLAFAAPEYLQASPITWTSDLYSMAKTLRFLYQKPSWMFSLWYQKATRVEPIKRFKTMSQATFAFFQWPSIGKKLIWLGLGLTLLYVPLQTYCYQSCLNQAQYFQAIKINPQKPHAFRLALEAGDRKDLTLWLALMNVGLSEVRDENFLWWCIHQLVYVENEISPYLQTTLLKRVDGAEQYLTILQTSSLENVQAFMEKASNAADRRFIYAYCLSFLVSLDEHWVTWLRTTLEDETILEDEEKWHYLISLSIKAKNQDWLEDVLSHLIQKKHAPLSQAEICFQLFLNGDYQSGWLHLAQQILERNELGPKEENLKDKIDSEIAMWGDLA